MISLWILLALINLYFVLRRRFLLSPTAIFFGYFAVVYPISYLVSYLFQIPSVFFESPRDIPPEDINYALLMIVVGLLAFCIARFLVPGPRIQWKDIRLIRDRITSALFVSVLVAILSAYALIKQLGGLSNILLDLGAIRSGELRGLGVQVYAVTMLVPTVMQFWLIQSLKSGARNSRHILLLCILSSLMGGAFGFRGPVLALLIQIACVCYFLTGTPTRKQIVAGLLVIIPAAVFSGLLRASDSVPMWTLMENADPAVPSLLANEAITRVRGVETLVIMTHAAQADGYHYFIDNLTETALSVVPSFVIGKGVSLPEKITTSVYSEFLVRAGIIKAVFGGVAYGIISEGYWNLGWMGVVVISAMAGYVLRFIEQGARAGACGIPQLIVIKAVAGFMPLFVESPQLGMNAICMNVVINLAVLVFLSWRISSHFRVSSQ
jgi:hypothetical protein